MGKTKMLPQQHYQLLKQRTFMKVLEHFERSKVPRAFSALVGNELNAAVRLGYNYQSIIEDLYKEEKVVSITSMNGVTYLFPYKLLNTRGKEALIEIADRACEQKKITSRRKARNETIRRKELLKLQLEKCVRCGAKRVRGTCQPKLVSRDNLSLERQASVLSGQKLPRRKKSTLTVNQTSEPSKINGEESK